MTNNQSKTTVRTVQLERMVRRLTLKLERLDGESLATQEARWLVEFDAVPLIPVAIVEAESNAE